MKRLAIAGAVVVAVLAVGVYRAKLGAEETQASIDDLRGEVRKVGDQIKVLKAEEAYLARPERIGPIARNQLGLAPAAPEQYAAPEMLSRRLGEERIPLPADPAAPAAPAATPKAGAP